MNRRKVMKMLLLGVFCVGFVLGSAWYSIHFNHSRLVQPMDFSTYVFQIKDLPMLLSIFGTMLYGIYLLVELILWVCSERKREAVTHFTRKRSPKLGFLGLLGFAGFFGIWTYSLNKTIFPFCFFAFFGFFGFFYEGKMSNIYMDERYLENEKKAELTSYRIGYVILFFLALLIGRGPLMGNMEYTLIFLMIGLALVFALVIFLSEYLLYRYDHGEEKE